MQQAHSVSSETNKKKIGLSLSGGGFRATVFHFGMMTRLAEAGLWDDFRHISTVSGGTLCAALIFHNAEKKWPDKELFLNKCLPSSYKLLTEIDIEREYALSLRFWELLEGRAHKLAGLLKRRWGLNENVSDMPMNPRWTINATCYETGKNWRFTADRMGDYKANYVFKAQYPLADAVATSAAVPALIGPLKLKTKRYTWHKYGSKQEILPTQPLFSTLTLWDGGVYDNLGVEALYDSPKSKKPGNLREDIDFLFVSDCSKPLKVVDRKWILNIPFPGTLTRLVDIPMDQVRSVRARWMVPNFRKNKNGGYLKAGKTISMLFEEEGIHVSCDPRKCLGWEEVQKAATFPTTLRKLQKDEFRLLYRHGYETCSAIMVIVGMDELIYFDDNRYPWIR